MKEYILFASDGSPIHLSQHRWNIAKKYRWFAQNDGNRRQLITYVGGKSFSFSTLVFGCRIRRKDPLSFDYTKRNIIYGGSTGRGQRLGKYSSNTSGYNYVYQAGNKWTVTIRINNIARYKGRFNDIEDAAIVADYWSYKYAGKNAYLNFEWDRRTLKRKFEEVMRRNGYSVDAFSQ